MRSLAQAAKLPAPPGWTNEKRREMATRPASTHFMQSGSNAHWITPIGTALRPKHHWAVGVVAWTRPGDPSPPAKLSAEQTRRGLRRDGRDVRPGSWWRDRAAPAA